MQSTKLNLFTGVGLEYEGRHLCKEIEENEKRVKNMSACECGYTLNIFSDACLLICYNTPVKIRISGICLVEVFLKR